MFFDLDGFKNINDHFGHDHGDYLLKTIAERVTSTRRKNDKRNLAGIGTQ